MSVTVAHLLPSPLGGEGPGGEVAPAGDADLAHTRAPKDLIPDRVKYN
ncbi:hypothetical protein FRUB_09674 [Fimbriiglobus ruber]|uniref:Uncharacterized protein n=1 Tax=Fimbriiglobus ruber TaxID=1908690 RepID=A0A225D006_9BACT|nr:hypothetical protein FRUB_09674 [Fimbriiglobus ruber]